LTERQCHFRIQFLKSSSDFDLKRNPEWMFSDLKLYKCEATKLIYNVNCNERSHRLFLLGVPDIVTFIDKNIEPLIFYASLALSKQLSC
jgi:hypothetical protein